MKILKNYKVELTTEWHDTVMNDMKCRHLIITFPQHEKECVEEFSKFTKIIPPTEVCHLEEIKQVINKTLTKNQTNLLLKLEHCSFCLQADIGNCNL